jgi:hypothetical protein
MFVTILSLDELIVVGMLLIGGGCLVLFASTCLAINGRDCLLL